MEASRLALPQLLSRLRLPGEATASPSALVTGRAGMHWDAGEFDTATGSAHLDLEPGPGDPPVTGTMDLSWKGKSLRFDSSTLDMPGSRILLTGGIDLTGQTARLDLNIDLSSSDVTPLARFIEERLSALFKPPPGEERPRLLPTDLESGIDANLTVRGPADALDVRADFRVGSAIISLPPLASGDVTRISLALSGADGHLTYTPGRFDLQLPHAEGEGLEASFGLSLDPETGDLLALSTDAARMPAELLGRLAGLDVGRLGLSGSTRSLVDLHRTGPGASLEGSLHLEADWATIAGLDLTAVKADGRLDAGSLLLDQASLNLFGGEVAGSGRVPLLSAPETGAGAVDIRAQGLDLSAVDERFEGPSLAGILDAEGTLTFGPTTGMTGRLTGTAIEIAGIRLGTVSGTITGSPEQPHLELQDSGGALAASATLSFTSTGAEGQPPQDSLPWIDMKLTARSLSLEMARPLLPSGALPGLEGEADGTVTAEGPLSDPSALVIRAVLDRLSLTAVGTPVRNEEPVRITLQDGFLTLAPTHLLGDKVDLTLAGSMVVGGSYDVTARLQGTYDLGLIQLLLPEMRASGPGTADLQVVQRADQLTYHGTITLDGGRVSDPALPQPLEQVRGSATFTENGRLVIDSMSFTTGGGTVTGSGWTRFEGATMPSMHLTMHGSGIRAEILPEFRAFFDADVTVDKVGEELRVGGNINVLRGIYSRSFGLEPADLMLRGRDFGPGSGPNASQVPIVLDLKIKADGGVWVRNDDARVETSADLSLAGTLAQPELSGRISAIEGGLFRFRDVTYTIVGGSLDFTDVTRIDPLLNIEASTRVQSYEVTLHVSGRFSKPIFDLTSDPPLSQREIVLLLLTGRVPNEAGNEATRGLAEGQVAGYLAAPVTGVVSEPLEKVLGVSSLQIDPYFLNGTADPSARLTITKQVTTNVLLTYSSSLGQSGQQVYQFEYNPGRIWDVLATRNFDGSLGTDLRFRRRWLGASTLAGAPEGEEPARVRLGKITLVADHLPEKGGKVVRSLNLDEGDPYRRGDLLEGREELRLYYARHGYPLAQVDMAEDEPASEDPSRVNVTYAVRSGPRYDVSVAGDVRHRPIRKAVKRAWSEPIMLEDLTDEAKGAARTYLVNKGHYSANVEAQETSPAPAVREVHLDVEPGPKVHVHSITITGNNALTEDLIRRQILTRESQALNPFHRGLLKQKVLQDDVDAIRGLYLAHGYLSAKVLDPEIELTPDGKEANVTINVQEGPQWKIGTVAVEGEAEGVPSELLLEKSGLQASQVVTTAAMSEATDRVRTTLDKNGYWKSRVSTHLEGEPESSRVVITIVPGERARVRNVTIEGNTRTQTRLVKREVTIEEGEDLSRTSILQTQRNLYGLGVFRSVEVSPEPVEGQPGLMDVKIDLREGSPLLTAWGVGYDTESRARASFELGHNNLFGTRRSAGLFVRESTVDRRYQINLRDPDLFGEKIESLWSGFFGKQEFDSYDERRRGASMQLSRKFGARTTVFGRYLLEDIDIYNLEVSISEARIQTARLGSFGLSLAYDTRDDIVNPTRGGFTTTDARLYDHVFGSQEDFWRLFASAARYREIGRKVVWASSVRAGLLTSDNIPISERFFAGGDTTIRGFAYNTVGPEDPNTGNPLGGQGLFILNTELRMPIYSLLKGVVFYDTGNVFATPSDYDLTDLRQVGGLGLRIDTPVGPFRVEYGWKLDRKPGESPGQFFFSIGQAF